MNQGQGQNRGNTAPVDEFEVPVCRWQYPVAVLNHQYARGKIRRGRQAREQGTAGYTAAHSVTGK
jgi:hypothetical protein